MIIIRIIWKRKKKNKIKILTKKDLYQEKLKEIKIIKKEEEEVEANKGIERDIHHLQNPRTKVIIKCKYFKSLGTNLFIANFKHSTR